jgi:hypothetical protein
MDSQKNTSRTMFHVIAESGVPEEETNVIRLTSDEQMINRLVKLGTVSIEEI